MATNIKITSLTDIGANLSISTLVPVVDVTGTPVTEKANLQVIGNLFLVGAGGSNFVAATRSLTSATVTNAAQPNITSVGTLTALNVTGTAAAGNVSTTGTITVANLAISGAEPLLGNSAITHSIPITVNGNTYYIMVSDTAPV